MVQSVNRALQILDYFLEHKKAVSLAQLHKDLGLPKPTIHRLVKCLENNNYIVRDESAATYNLSVKLMLIGTNINEIIKLREITLPIMRKVQELTQETVHLNILENGERVCIESLQGKSGLRVIVDPGQRSPLFIGASSKILLAYMEQEHRELYLSTLKKNNTLINFEILEQELDLIKKNGYGFSTNERVQGAFAISSPIFNSYGEVIAGLAIAAPISRRAEKEEQFKKLIIESCQEISQKLGYLKEVDN